MLNMSDDPLIAGFEKNVDIIFYFTIMTGQVA